MLTAAMVTADVAFLAVLMVMVAAVSTGIVAQISAPRAARSTLRVELFHII